MLLLLLPFADMSISGCCNNHCCCRCCCGGGKFGSLCQYVRKNYSCSTLLMEATALENCSASQTCYSNQLITSDGKEKKKASRKKKCQKPCSTKLHVFRPSQVVAVQVNFPRVFFRLIFKWFQQVFGFCDHREWKFKKQVYMQKAVTKSVLRCNESSFKCSMFRRRRDMYSTKLCDVLHYFILLLRLFVVVILIGVIGLYKLNWNY